MDNGLADGLTAAAREKLGDRHAEDVAFLVDRRRAQAEQQAIADRGNAFDVEPVLASPATCRGLAANRCAAYGAAPRKPAGVSSILPNLPAASTWAGRASKKAGGLERILLARAAVRSDDVEGTICRPQRPARRPPLAIEFPEFTQGPCWRIRSPAGGSENGCPAGRRRSRPATACRASAGHDR